MHLAVDAVGVKHGGGATVLLDFLEAVGREGRISRLTLFCSPEKRRRFALPVDPKLAVHEQVWAEDSYLYRILWYQAVLGSECSRLGVDGLFCMTGEGMTRTSVPHVTFIQQPLPFAAEFSMVATPTERLRMWTIKLLMKSSCRSAERVIVQTTTMRNWVSEQLGLAEERMDVVLPSVSPLPETPKTSQPLLRSGPGLKLLYVGSDSRYKNVETAVAGLGRLRAVLTDAELYLTWPAEREAALGPGVRCIGYLSRERLAQAYREATALVMPSLIETVGLPILEAMAAGTPVLAADRPYAHDIAEDAALFFNPLSPDDFAERAQELLCNQALRDELIRKGRELAARRAQTDPYQRMLDIVLKSARPSTTSQRL